MTAPNVPLTPSKPAIQGAASTGSQRDRRWTDTFFDTYKHPVKFPLGRPFTGEREFKSGTSEPSESAGFITSDLQQGVYYCDNPQMGQTQQERLDTLASAWECPWVPMAKYFRFNYRAKRVTFALDKMIADEEFGLNLFWDAAAKIAGENDIIDPERPAAVPFRIKKLLGNPLGYLGKIRLAQAMKAGDPWLVGFVTEPNEELAKILGKKVNYIGGHASDREYTVTPIVPEPPPIVTPEQVLSVPLVDVQKMIADAIAQHEATKAAARSAQMEKARNAKKNKAA